MRHPSIYPKPANPVNRAKTAHGAHAPMWHCNIRMGDASLRVTGSLELVMAWIHIGVWLHSREAS